MTHLHLILSPHFDDAVYSVYGWLRALPSARVTVATAFSAVPPDCPDPSEVARAYLAEDLGIESWYPGAHLDLAERRRAEDREVLSRLGLERRELGYLDAIFRGDPPLYAVEEALFGDPHPDDAPLLVAVRHRLEEALEGSPDSVVWLPLAVSRHVDHRILFRVGKELARRFDRIVFFEEFPYTVDPGALESRLGELPPRYEPLLLEVTDDLAAKAAAIAAYATQARGNFGSADRIPELLRQGPHRDGERSYERIWVQCPSGARSELEPLTRHPPTCR